MSIYRAIWRAWCAITGWKIVNRVSAEHKKFVIIAAPHTSNWDYPYTLAAAALLELEFSYLGKQDLDKGLLGVLFRNTGGIPVDRSKSSDLVRQVADMIVARDEIALAVAPEGTRSKRDYWKSGFYHIAKTANVPIVLGFVDFGKKEAGLGHVIWPIGEPHEVMEEIRDFYEASMAFHPGKYTEPRLKVEDAEPPHELPTEEPEAVREEAAAS